MKCPYCKSESRVLRSERAEETVRRKRECERCRHRWSTYEVKVGEYRLAAIVKQAVAETKVGIDD